MDNRNDKPTGSMDVNTQLQQWNHRLKQVISQIVRLEQQKSWIETEIRKEGSVLAAKWISEGPEFACDQSPVESPSDSSIVDFSGILELADDDEGFLAELIDVFLALQS